MLVSLDNGSDHWIMSMVDYDIRLTQWAFSGAIEEQHLGHWDIVGHDSHIQRSQTFRVHTENLFLFQSKTFPYLSFHFS